MEIHDIPILGVCGSRWNVHVVTFRESDVWQCEERAQNRENSRSHYHHIGRNNNNNNSQEKVFTLWDSPHPSARASVQVCRWVFNKEPSEERPEAGWRAAVFPLNRCPHLYDYSPASTYGPAPPPSHLCGHDSAQPLLTRSLERAQLSSAPSQYFGPPRPCYRTVDAGLDQVSSAGPGYQQQLCSTHGYQAVNTKTAKEFPIRIIRVWGQSEKP